MLERRRKGEPWMGVRQVPVRMLLNRARRPKRGRELDVPMEVLSRGLHGERGVRETDQTRD